jgi:hypothetical protein
MLPAAPHSINRRFLLLSVFFLGVVLLRGRQLQQAPRIMNDRSPRQLLAHDVLNIFERSLVRSEECQPVAIAPLARSPMLDGVSSDLHRWSVGIATPLPRRRRQQDKCRLVGVLDAEWIVWCAMHAQDG